MESEFILKRKKYVKIRKISYMILSLSIIVIGFFIGYRVSANGGGVRGLVATVLGHDEHTVEQLEELNILILGESDGLTDTILLASYNPKKQEGRMLSIPRDTFIGNNKYNAKASDKINSIYSSYGIEKLIEKVEYLTDSKISFYTKVDTKGLKELVDMIGGIDFYVPINMNYDDKKQNLHIHLKQGNQHINGEEAEQLIRFRHNNNGTSYGEEFGDNDFGRMKMRERILKRSTKKDNKNW